MSNCFGLFKNPQPHHAEFKAAIEKARIDALQNIRTIRINSYWNGLSREVNLVALDIRKLGKDRSVADVVRRIEACAQKINISNYNRKDIFFLQECAIALTSGDGLKALQNYGRACLKLDNNSMTIDYTKFVKKMSMAMKTTNVYNRNTFWGKIWWAIMHPCLVWNEWVAAHRPLEYNGSLDNPSFLAHTYQIGDKKARLYYGSGPTGSATYEKLLLPAYKDKQMEIRTNRQNTSEKHDWQRIEKLHVIAGKHDDVLKVFTIPFDRPELENISFLNVSGFFSEYKHKEGIVVYNVGEEEKTKYMKEFNDCLDKAQTFLTTYIENTELWKATFKEAGGKKRLAKVMLLVIGQFLTREFIKANLCDTGKQCVIADACKQHVDRGVVTTNAMRLINWESEGDPVPVVLTRNLAEEIAGSVFGRAYIVDDRVIEYSRYRVLEDFMLLLASKKTTS